MSRSVEIIGDVGPAIPFERCLREMSLAMFDEVPRHDVFLSSAFNTFMCERARIIALDPKRIWAAEIERPDLDTRKGVPPFFW